jgi:hypothetical protein
VARREGEAASIISDPSFTSSSLSNYVCHYYIFFILNSTVYKSTLFREIPLMLETKELMNCADEILYGLVIIQNSSSTILFNKL